MKLKLTADQVDDLPFPIGCPVWYNFPSNNDMQKDEPHILKMGVVESASFNYGSTNNDIIYEVGYKDDKQSMNIMEEVSEKNLAYGTNCPVTYLTDDGLELEGKVLLSEPSPDDPSKFVYTILIFMEGDRARYEMDIKDEYIKYRKVMGNTKSASVVEPDVPPIISDQKENQTETILATASEAPSEKEKETVPSSITCKSAISSDKSSKDGTEGSSKQLHNTQSVFTSQNKKNLHVDTTHKDANARHNQDSNRSTSYSHSSPSESRGASNHESFCLTTPAWLQRNSEVQRDLFFYLVGSKRDRVQKRTVSNIAEETNTKIGVVLHNQGQKYCNTNSRAAPPIAISVTAKHHTASDLYGAYEEIQGLLLDYLGVIDDVGSQGRLLWEVGASCPGPHRPRDSTNTVVRVARRYPDKFGDFISLVELPCEIRSGGARAFHVKYILQKHILLQIQKLHCFVSVCEDGFHGGPVKFSDPYVLLAGHTVHEVDQVVHIVRAAIRKHLDECNCNFR